MNFILLMVFGVLVGLRAWVMMKYREELFPKWYYGVSAAAIVIGVYWIFDMWSREYIVFAIVITGIALVDLFGVVFIMLSEWNMTKRRN